MWLLELVKHATENKDIGSWDISLKMKEMNETFNECYTMNKGDPNYEHFAEHGSNWSVFQCIPVSIETTKQSRD